MQGVDPNNHHGAGFDQVAVDFDVLHRHPAHRGGRRAQAQSLVHHLDRVPEPRNVLRCEGAVAQCGDCGDF